MYSSNQILSISCDVQQLKKAIQFALDMDKLADESNRMLCWQVAENDAYIAIGWYYKELPDGWNRFPLDDPSTDMIVETIRQFCKTHPDISPELYDGGYGQGYLIEVVPDSMASERNGLKSPFYGIFSVKAHKLFYSK